MGEPAHSHTSQMGIYLKVFGDVTITAGDWQRIFRFPAEHFNGTCPWSKCHGND